MAKQVIYDGQVSHLQMPSKLFTLAENIFIQSIKTAFMNQHSYTKQELALLYFPDATPEVASAHLRRWIILCKPLYEQLLKTGYSKWAKGFTPTQVSYIFAYLGEP